jgi:hypothetical protein
MPSSRLRYPLLGLSLLILMAAIWGGLVRMGWRWPPLQSALALAHGPLMVSGFLGTLIGIERAVALRQRWTYLGPLATGLGGMLLLLGVPGPAGPALITLGSAGLVAVHANILRSHLANFTLVLAAGALAWLVGNLFWLSGWPIYHVVLWWAGFLVLTIAGERLELGRIMRLSPLAEATFLAATGIFLAGLALSMPSYDLGTRLAGFGMLTLAAWLLHYDISRKTLRKPGLPRYIAACLLSGYVWLGAAGVLGMIFGGTAAGPRYDAFLHAIFLGFVFSMIFGHAPIIFPSVLGVEVRFRPWMYTYLVLLQASTLLRVSADLAYAQQLRLWGGLLNGLALTLFVSGMVYSTVRSRLSNRMNQQIALNQRSSTPPS